MEVALCSCSLVILMMVMAVVVMVGTVVIVLVIETYNAGVDNGPGDGICDGGTSRQDYMESCDGNNASGRKV